MFRRQSAKCIPNGLVYQIDSFFGVINLLVVLVMLGDVFVNVLVRAVACVGLLRGGG